ncbi:hypothetical protein SFRURICE_008396 [Spodoptera frugiperda]|nr:hypothetical protein SFRURICE_008396 [Spodoptera frugiperda]
MAQNVTVQCSPTFHHLCYKFHVIGGQGAQPTQMGPSRADAQSGAADNVKGYRGSGSKQEKERRGF